MSPRGEHSRFSTTSIACYSTRATVSHGLLLFPCSYESLRCGSHQRYGNFTSSDVLCSIAYRANRVNESTKRQSFRQIFYEFRFGSNTLRIQSMRTVVSLSANR